MNWRGGMLRLWIVTSVIWAGTISLIAYQNIAVPRLQSNRCLERSQINGHNPFDCFDPNVVGVFSSPSDVIFYVALALGPVGTAFVLWFIGKWIVAGFKARQPGG
jgi:hypothetical protein